MFFLLTLGFGLVLIFFHILGELNENYWRKRGVKFHNRNKVFGPFWDFVVNDRPFFQLFNEIYIQHRNEPVVGIGSLFTPALYVIDKTNLQYVMQSPAFIDRGFDYNKDDLLADNILFMTGIRWKLMRQKMTPLFTAAKLKTMFYAINKSTQDFIKYLHKNPDKRKENTFDTLTTFSCAALSNAVFGVSVSETDFNSPFLKGAKNSFRPTLWRNTRFSIAHLSPFLFKSLNLKYFKPYEKDYFNAMKQMLNLRNQESAVKHDFADICLDMQKEGTIRHEESGYEMEPTVELLSAQGFFFFAAGAEPTATAIFATLISLGNNPEIKKKLEEEINDIVLKHNGDLNVDAIMEMEYLEKVLCESLRIFPPIGYLTRRCVEDTVLPVGNIRVNKGTKIYTPIYEYHHDPEFFKDPEVFDPERFTEGAKQAMGISYMPFGFGTRVCIGLRYAKLQVKCVLAYIVRNFDLKTHIKGGKINFRSDQVQLRMTNVNVELIPRSEN